MVATGGGVLLDIVWADSMAVDVWQGYDREYNDDALFCVIGWTSFLNCQILKA